jgi:hypothetical protein
MPANRSDAEEIGALLVTFAADLTDAAYSVALQHGIAGSWIDLQLEVWRAVGRTIAEIAPESPSSSAAGELDSLADAFLAELTQAAHGIVLRYGLLGSFLDFELDLHQSLRRVIEPWEAGRHLQRVLGPRTRLMADAVLSRFDDRHAAPRPSMPAASQLSVH